MIYYYSGNPGTGKSLHLAKDIYNRLNRNKKYPNVIANFDINRKMIKNKEASFIFKDNEDLDVKFLVLHALKNHEMGIENQTMLIIDEAYTIWDARAWQNNKSRTQWIKFLTQHRKLGYKIIATSQNDRQLDKQVRSLFEYEVKHRKINNFKIGKFLPFATFIAITCWYANGEKMETEIFTYRKKWGNFYDSYGTFDMDKTLTDLIDV